MKKLFLLIGIAGLCACTQVPQTIEVSQIEQALSQGQFTQADSLIRYYLAQNPDARNPQFDQAFMLDWMQRVRRDFGLRDSAVTAYLQRYYDSISPAQRQAWEASNALENMMIDGEKCYFNSAPRNLFRIDSFARKHWEAVHGDQPDSLDRFLAHHIPSLLAQSKREGREIFHPVRMEVNYTLSVKPNVVPAGEVLRVWMPFPRTDIPRQTEVRLLSAGQEQYILAPDSYAHKSIYMEQTAVEGQPTVFTYRFAYTARAQWAHFSPESLQPYNTSSALYQEFTAERAPQLVFSERIRELCQSIVGDEKNPYLKVQKIYDYIDRNFPWASAREYSTLFNIPEYVLDNRHGDCGQVSLLFICLARCAGVPAKWQSGWMMHPGNKNLHDWAEVYYEGLGWIPVDMSFGRTESSKDPEAYWYYTKGIDPYRLVVNQDYSQNFFPAKIYPRSETIDFQRGEVEWRGGNLYFGDWQYRMDISYL